MDTKVCVHCSTRVLPSADGICPSCRAAVSVVAQPVATSSTAAGFDRAVRHRVAEVSETVFNPYASPRSNDVDGALEHEAQVGRGFRWMLFSFSGRIPRRTIWGVSIGMIVALYALLFLALAIRQGLRLNVAVIVPPAYVLFMWISLAAQAKRWHDRDKSGWWSLIAFVPFIGPLWIFIELGWLRGTIGPNRFGPDPT